MLLNMIISTGGSGESGTPITAYIYGLPNETVYLAGTEANYEFTLDGNGYAEVSILSGYYTITGTGKIALVYPDGIQTKITATNNIVYVRPETIPFWYGGFVQGGSWKKLDEYMADTERELMGDATVGWSTQADSNGTSEYWCKIGPSTPYTIPEGATKCCILASGYGWTADYQLPTATGNAYYTPYGRCYVGINETGGQSSNLTGGTQKVCKFNIGSYTGTTITPYAYSAERGDSGGAHPGTHSPKTTVYGVWFE